MKRFIISSFFTLFLFSVTHAQYNRFVTNAQDGVGNNTYERGWDIVEADNGHTCVLSSNWEYFNLKEFDFSGNIMRSETFHLPALPTHEYYLAERLLHTTNGEYIVVGRNLTAIMAGSPQVIPFAARFVPAGGGFNCIWFEEYPVNGSFSANTYNMPESQINIVRAEDDPQETYIIVTEGDDIQTPLAGSNVHTINAMKIDGMNGNIIWNNKYYDNSGTVRDFHVSALAYGEDNEIPAAGKYFIGGSVDKQISFDMTIDGNGTIVDPYREYDMPGDEFYHSVLYDPATSEFVLANTISSTNAGNTIHQIAISKIDVTYMTIKQTDYYYEDDPASTSCSTISRKIIEDDTKSFYIVGGQTEKDLNGTGTIYSGTSILKVDKTANVQFLKRYNNLAVTYGMSIAKAVDPGTSTENYAAVSLVGTANTRVLTTDVNGVTCGDELLTDNQGDFSLSPIGYSFNTVSVTGQQTVNPTPGNAYTINNCDPLRPQYKTTGIATTEDLVSNIKVYPTVLSYNERVVRLDVSSTTASDVTVTAYSIDGKQVAKNSYSIEQGSSTLKFDTGIEISGTYILRIESDNQELIDRVKISKL